MDELVNIPALLYFSDGGTEFEILSVLMVCALIALRVDIGKSVSPNSRSCLEAVPSGSANLRRRASQKNL